MYEGALASVAGRRPGEHHPVRPGRRRPRPPAARRRSTGAAQLFADSHAVARRTRRRGQPAGGGRRGTAGPRARRPGRRAGAPTCAQQMLAGLNEPEWTATALVGLGHLAELTGDLDSAESFHRRAWRTHPGRPPPWRGWHASPRPAATPPTRHACSAPPPGGGSRSTGPRHDWKRPTGSGRRLRRSSTSASRHSRSPTPTDWRSRSPASRSRKPPPLQPER